MLHQTKDSSHGHKCSRKDSQPLSFVECKRICGHCKWSWERPSWKQADSFLAVVCSITLNNVIISPLVSLMNLEDEIIFININTTLCNKHCIPLMDESVTLMKKLLGREYSQDSVYSRCRILRRIEMDLRWLYCPKWFLLEDMSHLRHHRKSKRGGYY